ncbi:MAG: hypothetical protein ACFFB0_15675 [Promethearchaeota archaeon]
MSDPRVLELRIENKRLKEQITALENKILTLVGMFDIESSGDPSRKNFLNDQILNLINSTKEQLNIVTPKIDDFYAKELKKLVQRGIPIILISNDRADIPKEYRPIYDDLKLTEGISMINNPNVRFLLLFNSEQAVYAGSSLVKEELANAILIVTSVREKSKLRKISQIFSLMLPSFMRK